MIVQFIKEIVVLCYNNTLKNGSSKRRNIFDSPKNLFCEQVLKEKKILSVKKIYVFLFFLKSELDNEQKKQEALNKNDNEGLKQGTGENNQLTYW